MNCQLPLELRIFCKVKVRCRWPPCLWGLMIDDLSSQIWHIVSTDILGHSLYHENTGQMNEQGGLVADMVMARSCSRFTMHPLHRVNDSRSLQEVRSTNNVRWWVCTSIRSRVRRFELVLWLNHNGAGPSSRIDGKASLFTTKFQPPSKATGLGGCIQIH